MCRTYGAWIHIATTHTSGFAYALLQCGLTCGRASGARIFKFSKTFALANHQGLLMARSEQSTKHWPQTWLLFVLGCQRPSSWQINARRFWKRFLGFYFMPLSSSAAHAWPRFLYAPSSHLICAPVSSSTRPTIVNSVFSALNRGEIKTIRAFSRSFAAGLSLATSCRSLLSVLISGKD